MSIFRFATLRARIVALCVVTAIVALVTNTVVGYFVASRFNDASTDTTLRAVQQAHALAIGEWIKSREQMIESLRDAVFDADPEPALRQIAAAGGFVNVYVGYPNKTARFSKPDGIPPTYDPTTRAWFKQAIAAGKTIVTAPYEGAASHRLFVAFAVPVMRNGAVAAVVAGDMPMDSVIANVSSIHPTRASFGVLIDSAGKIVAHSDPKRTLTPVAELAPELTGEKLQSLFSATQPLAVDVDGASKLMLSHAVEGTD